MPTTDPLVALQNALLTHLADEVSIGDPPVVPRTRRGWPEHHTDLDLRSGPMLVTVIGEDTQIPINPRPVGTTDDGETIYKVAELSAPLQLRCLAAYRAVLDLLVEAVDSALSNRLPGSPDLWLDSTDYHGRPLIFTRRRLRREGRDQAAAVGEWEAVWSLDCTSDRVLLASHPEITTITTRLTELTTNVTEDTTAASSS